LLTAWLTASALLIGAGLPDGTGKVELEVAGTRLEVFTYKPAGYKAGPLILVFHGVLRNADEYRDHARKMGDRLGAIIVAPRFDATQFPTAKYQLGGLLRDGKVVPQDEWTWSLIPKLADELRRREERPDLPYYLIGHSGGGQFLVRMAGFVPTGARRVVAANPGSHLFPTREMDYPYGFGSLPEELNSDAGLRRYLAQPLTIYLGTADTQQDRYFDRSERANRQGGSRYERGQNAFREAEQLAKKKGWTFNWRLVTAADVGHDHEAMFNHPACDQALFGPKGYPMEESRSGTPQLRYLILLALTEAGWRRSPTR
jgi:poly(3-hydroxybutyrate) depolymerase